MGVMMLFQLIKVFLPIGARLSSTLLLVAVNLVMAFGLGWIMLHLEVDVFYVGLVPLCAVLAVNYWLSPPEQAPEYTEDSEHL